MTKRAHFCLMLSAILLWPTSGCHRAGDRPPPPDARRPVIKSAAELATERQQRIQSGQVVPSAPPRLAAESSRRNPTIPIRPTPGAIEAEILLVNDAVLTLPELLYPLREDIAEARRKQSPEGFLEAVQRMLPARAQQAVGALLIHREAVSNLSDPQREIVEDGVQREIQKRISREFGDSSARFEKHLAECGLTLEQYRTLLERELVARQYTREKLLPQVTVRRDELLSYYRRNQARYASDEIRELWLIEAPFAGFLPPETQWAAATSQARAQAKLRAARHIRAAHEALSTRSFEEVAGEYSRGPHASQGGLWGEIGRPLQPPYDQASQLIFSFTPGQCSEPVEGEQGWYLVRCGDITPAHRRTFGDAQEEIRQALIEQKFERLSADYMIQLANRATISALDPFLQAAARRVLQEELKRAEER